MVTYDQILNYVEGFKIRGASIRDSRNIFLFFENHYDENKDGPDWIQETLLMYFRPDTSSVWGGEGFTNLPDVMGVCLTDQDQTMVFVDSNGNIVKQGIADGSQYIDQPKIPIENRESLLDISLIDLITY